MMRQIGKQILTIVAWLGLAVAAHAQAATTPIVTDPLTGVAIEGYDPVTYFIEPEPRQGVPDYEYVWNGVSWYFVSAANRDVFARNPTVYAPQYGGHCLMSLSRGYLSDGKPRLFVIEALSVIVQVASFKLTGKRFFRMAPIHHHYEQKGWTEPQIVIRFWIVSVMLALAGLSTLKLR